MPVPENMVRYEELSFIAMAIVNFLESNHKLAYAINEIVVNSNVGGHMLEIRTYKEQIERVKKELKVLIDRGLVKLIASGEIERYKAVSEDHGYKAYKAYLKL